VTHTIKIEVCFEMIQQWRNLLGYIMADFIGGGK
jgi:hypothetical protein